MVSVCMATKNGERFIIEQLDSILPQLKPEDELIISDDHSSDDTIKIILSYGDPRIKLHTRKNHGGIIKNFEASLRLSKGEYIFLADQDDVWLPHKRDIMLEHLHHHDLVISDCLLVDEKLQPRGHSFFTRNKSRKGLVKNLFKNSYMGCCMAFKRSLLEHALPFPKDIPIHDFWIGLIGELYFKVYFTPEVLVYHRRHETNATTTGSVSSFSLKQKFAGRYHIIKSLLFHNAYAK